MKTVDNTGLGLIKATIERVQNKESLFNSVLKKLVNSSEEELSNFLNDKRMVVDSLADKFYVIKEFYITVPLDYDPKKHLKNFAKKYKKDFLGYNDNITDQKEYSNPSYDLIPGKRYKVIIWGINKGMIATYLECLQLLSDNNVLLTGAPGISLVFQQAKDKLPIGKWTFSYDKEDKLWKDTHGYHRVPGICRYSDGDYFFYLNYFGNDRADLDCLHGFGDCEPLAS
jgi:hypothetical protein